MLVKSTLTYEEIETIDNLITKVLNAATNKVEGQSRNIPYTKEKVKRQGTMLFWKAKIWQLKGIPVDKEVLRKRQEIHDIECNEEIELDQAQQKLQDALERWKELKLKGKELRE